MFTLILFCIFFDFFLSGLSTQFRVMTSLYGTSGSQSSDPPHSVGVLWTSDQPNAETAPWKHKILSRDRHPCCRWDSKPQSQQASGHRYTPWTARSLGSVFLLRYQEIFSYLGIYGVKRQVLRLTLHYRYMWCTDSLFFSKMVPFMRQCGRICRVAEATDGNTTHVHCMLDN